jgi:hypothetical protein
MAEAPVTTQELLISSLAQTDALAKLLTPRVFSLPLPLSTRCLIPKTYGVGPQSP